MALRLALLFLGCLAVAFGARDYILENSEGSMTCEAGSDWRVLYWLLHKDGEIGGQAFEVGQSYERDEIIVSGRNITFKHVKLTHEGTHLCVAKSNSQEIRGWPVRMYVRPLPADDLWEAQYKSQFLVGLLSAIVCAVILGGSCLVYKYRWRPKGAVPLENEHEHDKGHVNAAMDQENVQSINM